MNKVILGFLRVSDLIQKYTSPRIVKDLIFLLVIFLLVLYIGVFDDAFYYPQGLHVWRQSDGLAQIMNYYQNDLDCFDWGLAFNQFENQGRGVAEFPIHYYFQAVLWKMFGVNYWTPQVYSTVLTSLGLYCFYRATTILLKNAWISMLIAFLFFFSPLFNAYAFRVMPDAYALATLNMAFYFTVLYSKKNKNIWLFLSILFLTLTGVVKIFYIIPYIAFLAVVFWDIWNKKSLRFTIWKFFLFLIPLALSYGWIFIMRNYNNSVEHHYFLVDTLPYWDLDHEGKNAIWSVVKDEWVYQMFNFFFLRLSLIFGFVSIFFLLFMKEYKWIMFLGLSILGILSFDTLIYRQLMNHDYYFLTHLFLVIGVWIVFFRCVKILVSNIFYTRLFSVIILIFFCFQFSFINAQYEWRYTSWRNEASRTFRLFENIDLIDKFIPEDAIVIIPEDGSPSYTLSIIQRQGWSGYQLKYNRYSATQMFENGAEYVIFYDKNKLPKDFVEFDLQVVYKADHFMILKIKE